MITYKILLENDINKALFNGFVRYQEVTKCLRKRDGQWVVEADPFIDDWHDSDYDELILDLCQTIHSGGFVYGAFVDGQLKGFVSVRSGLFGSSKQYLDLAHLYVSQDIRRYHIGKNLFEAAKLWASHKGAKKLYISAHSAIESQKFYYNMGCVEAKEYSLKHVEKEPYDCQMEYVLENSGNSMKTS